MTDERLPGGVLDALGAMLAPPAWAAQDSVRGSAGRWRWEGSTGCVEVAVWPSGALRVSVDEVRGRWEVSTNAEHPQRALTMIDIMELRMGLSEAGVPVAGEVGHLSAVITLTLPDGRTIAVEGGADIPAGTRITLPSLDLLADLTAEMIDAVIQQTVDLTT